METGFMYHARGIREQVYASTSYEGGRIILKIKTREQTLLCKVLKPSRDEERQHGETFPLRSHRVAPDNNRDDGAAPGVEALRCDTAGEDLLCVGQGAVYQPFETAMCWTCAG